MARSLPTYRLALASGLLWVLLAWAAPAMGFDIPEERVPDLAERSIDDPNAQDQLEGVTSIDGIPVDLTEALGGEDTRIERADHLEANQPVPYASGSPGDDAQRIAEQLGPLVSGTGGADIGDEFLIEGDGEYGEVVDEVPEPESPLEAQESTPAQEQPDVPDTQPLPEEEEPFFEPPDLWWVQYLMYAIGGAIIIALAIWLVRSIRSRRELESDNGTSLGSGKGARPSWMTEADAAEAAGHYARAIRLRYEGGLRAMAERGQLVAVDGMTSDELLQTISQSPMPELVRDHELVAYGMRRATQEDAVRSRSNWERWLQRSPAEGSS